MDCELGFNSYRFKVHQLLLKTHSVLVLNIRSVDACYLSSMAAQREVLPCEIKLVVAICPFYLEVSCEVISAESSSNKSVFSHAQYILTINECCCGLNLGNNF